MTCAILTASVFFWATTAPHHSSSTVSFWLSPKPHHASRTTNIAIVFTVLGFLHYRVSVDPTTSQGAFGICVMPYTTSQLTGRRYLIENLPSPGLFIICTCYVLCAYALLLLLLLLPAAVSS